MSTCTSHQLGKTIKQLRNAAGLTQEELADQAGVSYSALAKLEQGKIANPSFFTIVRLSELLDSSLDQLAGIVTKTPQSAPQEPKTAITTIIFDIHGVLVCDWEQIFSQLAHLTGADPLQAEESFWRYDSLVAEGLMTINDFERALAADLHTDPNSINYQNIYRDAVTPFKPAHDLLLQLHASYHIALMSNIFPGFIDILFEQKALPLTSSDYSALILSPDVKSTKPRTHIYEVAEATCGEPSSLLLIDDSPDNVAAATKRGWHGVVYIQEEFESAYAQIKRMLSH